MDVPIIIDALRENRTIDITTSGAKTGRPRRIEIWAWPDGDRVYLTGTPGRRDWYANLRAHRPIEDPAERRAVFVRLRPSQVDAWTARSPLVEVEFS